MDTKTKTLKAVLDIAISQIGAHEVGGNNEGPKPRAYLAAAHVSVPAPWCAAFVAWCFESAHVDALWAPPNLAYCPSVHAWARALGILHTKPQVGDVFLYIADGWALHTGFVVGVRGDGTRFTTVEGNTGGKSEFDGDVVASKERPVNGAYVFVRPGDLIKDTSVSVETPWALLDVHGNALAAMSERGGRSWIRMRDWEHVSGQKVTWDQEAQAPRVAGKRWVKPFEIRGSGLAWAMANDLLAAAGLAYRVDLSAHSVILL